MFVYIRRLVLRSAADRKTQAFEGDVNQYDLDQKFGVNINTGKSLLLKAKEMDLNVLGIR